jgi:hypothetical protein
MAKKIVSLFVLAAFSIFSMSCFTYQRRGIKKTVKKDVAQVDRTNTKLEIVNIITKEGKNIPFRNNDPGNFVPGGEAVVGTTLQELEFDKKDIKISHKGKTGKISQIETGNGRIYKVLSSTEEADRVRISTYAPITIPFSDIQQVWIRKTDVAASVVLGTFAIVGMVLLTVLAIDAIKNIHLVPEYDSCPFVYSFNGEEYVLDAEPYGMAITEGLKRTDWVEMSNLRDVGGKYRVLLANELKETQYTDELKLAVVDHAVRVKIAPDTAGRMHTFARPIAPMRAVDGKGRDILTFVAKNDLVFWTSRLEEKSADDGEMRDELVFEFPKPAGAKKAKLLANAWTTQWGSLSAGRFLKLYGSSLPERYADVDRFGPTYRQFLKWMSSEELYTMKIWVETPSGWKARGMIYGGAPVVAKDKAYVLDVGDVSGEVLRIKLRPPVNFWMVNSLAVDYGEDSPVQVAELAAERAVDPLGRDVREDLAATDGSYQTSSNRGERTELVFAVPPMKEGLERTVFVKASGYYRIHIDAKGEPQTERIARVLGEPGFAARYSFREYQKWEAALRAEVEKAKRRGAGATAPVKSPS